MPVGAPAALKPVAAVAHEERLPSTPLTAQLTTLLTSVGDVEEPGNARVRDTRRAGLGDSRVIVVAISEREAAAAIHRRRVGQRQLTAGSRAGRSTENVPVPVPVLQPGGNVLRSLVIVIAVAGLPSSVVKVSVTGTEPLLTTAPIVPLGSWVAHQIVVRGRDVGDRDRTGLRSAGIGVVAVLQLQRAARDVGRGCIRQAELASRCRWD